MFRTVLHPLKHAKNRRTIFVRSYIADAEVRRCCGVHNEPSLAHGSVSFRFVVARSVWHEPRSRFASDAQGGQEKALSFCGGCTEGQRVAPKGFARSLSHFLAGGTQCRGPERRPHNAPLRRRASLSIGGPSLSLVAGPGGTRLSAYAPFSARCSHACGPGVAVARWGLGKSAGRQFTLCGRCCDAQTQTTAPAQAAGSCRSSSGDAPVQQKQVDQGPLALGPPRPALGMGTRPLEPVGQAKPQTSHARQCQQQDTASSLLFFPKVWPTPCLLASLRSLGVGRGNGPVRFCGFVRHPAAEGGGSGRGGGNYRAVGIVPRVVFRLAAGGQRTQRWATAGLQPAPCLPPRSRGGAQCNRDSSQLASARLLELPSERRCLW